MSILDLSKWHMYNFHYNVMKAIFGDRVHLLYTDTDSFIYEISSADVYEELRPHARDYFDFSNYPENHMLKIVAIKRCLVNLKMSLLPSA